MEIYNEPEKLLAKLIAFDTSNPPGRERECCMFIKEILDGAGIETSIYALNDDRPNLWAEIRSENPTKPAVLMYGHIDVVPAEPANWKHPPFSATVDGDYIYGRGVMDMKAALAMFVCVMLKVKLEGIKLDFDLRLLLLSDEEQTGKYGAKYMVENYAELFEGVGCALGEVGGFSLHMGGKRFYPIMVAEKQCGGVRLTFRGKSGHGSARHTNTAMEKLARAVAALCANRLKTRITPEVAAMIREISRGFGGLRGFMLKLLLVPSLTNRMLALMGEEGLFYDNLLHNSVNVTIVNGGTAGNVVPESVSCELDLRVLPGCSLQEALGDITEIIANKAGLSEKDYELEVLEFDENTAKPDLSCYEPLRSALLEADSDGIPFPYVVSASTDGRVLSKVGIMTYGFTPMRCEQDFDFFSQLHAANERIPLGACAFGIETIMAFLMKFY